MSLRRALSRDQQLRQRFIDLARREAPREACGLISYGKGSYRVRRAENAADDPLTRFVIANDQADRIFGRIEAAGETFVGIFHSHPSQGPEPSELDRAVARTHAHPSYWVIVGLYGGERDPAISVTRLP